MEKRRVDELVLKYNEGLADPSEMKWIEQLIESGEVELTQLHELAKLDEYLMAMNAPAPTFRLDDHFYAMLADEKREQRIKRFSFSMPDWSSLFPRLAFAVVLLLIGFSGGYLFMRPTQNDEVHELTQQVSDLKEMMMFSLLEKESASERLKAVSLTSSMNTVSQKVTLALFQTLNSDENVNVRLAALEALVPYVKDSRVREGLVESIASQDSPLVQVALAELMVSLAEKKSVKELQRIVNDQNTPKDVKNKITESIKVLI